MGIQHEETISSMGKSGIGSHVRLYLYRIPKKNHNAMVQLGDQFADMFKNYGCYARSFQLESTETSEDFTNAANAVSVNQNEEVWLDLEFTTDRKHQDDVDTKIQNDERAGLLMKQYMELLVQGSRPIKSDFIRSRT
jgi:uncharacterized protein YbaA (DUF1428 family)